MLVELTEGRKHTIEIFEKLSIMSDVEEHGVEKVLQYTFNREKIDFINYLKGKSKVEFREYRLFLYGQIDKCYYH